MRPLSHRVQALQITLHSNSVQAAEPLRAQLRAWAVDDAPECLAQVCDAWCQSGEVRRIKSLDITVRIDDLSTLTEAVQTELWRQLEPWHPQLLPKPVVNSLPISVENSAQTVVAFEQENLIQYLLHGKPSWSMVMQAREILLQQWQQQLKVNRVTILQQLQPSSWISWLSVLRRVMQLTPGEERESVHEILLAQCSQTVPTAWRKLAEQQGLEAVFFRFWIATWRASDSVAKFFQELMRQLVLDAPFATPHPKLVSAMGEITESRDAQNMAQAMQTLMTFLPERSVVKSARSVSPVPVVVALDEGEPSNDVEPASPIGRSMFHAGMVLLHPYLPTLFDACGICRRRDKTIAPAQQARAAQLLHYLACGELFPQDFDLSCYSLLLGVYPRAVPSSVSPLGQQEREEAEALLQAVLSHWPALKQTSANSLRLSFLQRRGVLIHDEQGLSLHLHKEAFDVLLTHLPWSINTVKLPWMPKPLLVVW